MIYQSPPNTRFTLARNRVPDRQSSDVMQSASRRLLILMCLICLVAAPYTADAQNSRTPVTLQLKWQHQFQFAGYYAANTQGFYRDAGLDVEIVPATESVDPIQAVINGDADFGVGTSELVLWRSRGAPVVVLGVIFQHSPLLLLAPQRDDIDSLHSLIGKRVAIEPNSAELLAYLHDEGIDISQLDVVDHGFSPTGLIDGSLDAMSAYSSDEPFLLQQEGLGYMTFSPRSAGIDFYGDVLFTTEAVIQQHPERVQAFLDASMAGWRYAFDNEEAMIDYIYNDLSQRHSREHLAFEAEQMRRLILPDLIEPGYMVEGRWRYILDTYQRVGLLHTPFTVTDMLYQPNLEPDLSPIYSGLAIAGGLTLLVGLVSLRFYRLYAQLRRQSREREQAQALLAESERRYRSLIESAPFPVVITGLSDHRLRYMNPRAEALFKLGPGAHIGKPAVSAYANPEDRARLVEQVQQKNHVDNFETTLLDAAGNPFWASITANSFVFEHEPALFVTFSDLSERRQMEGQLRKSESLYRSILHASPDPILITDMQARLVMISPAGLKMFGYEDTPPREGEELVHWIVPEQRDRALVDFEDMRAGGEAGFTEFRMLHADGHEIMIESNSEIIRDVDNKPHQLVVILRDVTERKLAEAQALALAVEQERVKLLTGFIQNASHEFRTPLSVINSGTYLLTRADDRAKREVYAGSITEQVSLITRLVEMLTQIASLDSGAPLTFAPVDLVVLARDSMSRAQPEAQKSDIVLSLRTGLSATLPVLDAEKIRVALNHLLDNAIRYTLPGGKVDLHLYNRDSDIIFEVCDTGIGISEDLIPHIFDHFWRQDEAHSTPGLGLGLTLAGKIVEAHHGRIEVESVVGQGSVFRMCIPLDSQSATSLPAVLPDGTGESR